MIKKIVSISYDDPASAEKFVSDVLLSIQEISKRKVDLGDTPVLAIIGFTGEGKSTLANWLSGKTLRKESALGASASGWTIQAEDPVSPIGVGTSSMTDFPVVCPVSAETRDMCVVDFPGIEDTRGPVQDITNRFSTVKILMASESIRFVLLISYPELDAKRASGLRFLGEFLEKLFADDLQAGLQSVILGVSKVPLDVSLEDIRGFLGHETFPESLRSLSRSMFIYDPLNRSLEGGLSREQVWDLVLGTPPFEISGLHPVLGQRTEMALCQVVRLLDRTIRQAFGSGEYKKVATSLGHLFALQRMQVQEIDKTVSSLREWGNSQISGWVQGVQQSLDRDNVTEANVIEKRFQTARGDLGSVISDWFLVGELIYKFFSQYEQKIEKRRNDEVDKIWREAHRLSGQDISGARRQLQKMAALIGTQDNRYVRMKHHIDTLDIQFRQEAERNARARRDAELRAAAEQRAREEQVRILQAQAAAEARRIQQNIAVVQYAKRSFDRLNGFQAQIKAAVGHALRAAERDGGYVEQDFHWRADSWTQPWGGPGGVAVALRHETQGWVVFDQNGIARYPRT